MAADPPGFVKDLYGKVIDAAKTLPAPFLYAVLVIVTVLVWVIAMAVLHVDLQNNVLWLIGIIIIACLVAWFVRGGGPASTHDQSKTATGQPAAAQTQRVIYDSTHSKMGFYLKGYPNPIFDANGVPTTPTGAGELNFLDGGILDLQRGNTDGRYEIRLVQYSYDGGEREYLPRNVAIGGRRKLELSFEAKVTNGAQHTLKAVIYCDREKKWTWLDWKEVKVTDSQWKSFHVPLIPDASCNSFLRIDDMEVSKPSSIQIRKILLTEQAEM